MNMMKNKIYSNHFCILEYREASTHLYSFQYSLSICLCMPFGIGLDKH